MARTITGSVVVVTGASSGIGRATAIAFARRGANLVLGARGEEALRDVAAECEAVGAPAVVIPTDVRDEAAVDALAKGAIEAFDRIDVWVNSAGVFMLGKLEDVPPEAFRELIETNLFGSVNGARAAIPHLRASGGVLVNVASAAGTMGMSHGTAYASSKWAVRGFSESLRQELRRYGIDVVTILPASIDTPLFDHAANYTGRGIRPLTPIYPAEEVAEKIVACVRRPRGEAMVGTAGQVARLFRAMLPTAFFDRQAAERVERKHLDQTSARDTLGNIDEPQAPFAIEGGWRERGPRSVGLPKLALALGIAAVPAVFAVVRMRQHRPRRLARFFA
jgi:NAD(P)-dependent dehydrogenase (short-subunit alcohol dehydrogenase family)